jgi:hypothetical protein
VVNGALTNQNARSEKNSFKRQDRRQQGKRIFIEALVNKI